MAAIQKQQGPAGPPGQNGAAGTARAYATITPSCTGSGPEICTFVKSKGITAVERTGVNYCVRAPGIDPATTSAVVGRRLGQYGLPRRRGPGPDRRRCP
ncbi:MAG: hypothetical protein ACXWGV_00015 [Solirubrobacterales bacterium]